MKLGHKIKKTIRAQTYNFKNWTIKSQENEKSLEIKFLVFLVSADSLINDEKYSDVMSC